MKTTGVLAAGAFLGGCLVGTAVSYLIVCCREATGIDISGAEIGASSFFGLVGYLLGAVLLPWRKTQRVDRTLVKVSGIAGLLSFPTAYLGWCGGVDHLRAGYLSPRRTTCPLCLISACHANPRGSGCARDSQTSPDTPCNSAIPANLPTRQTRSGQLTSSCPPAGRCARPWDFPLSAGAGRLVRGRTSAEKHPVASSAREER
jgi:hypothetical protein